MTLDIDKRADALVAILNSDDLSFGASFSSTQVSRITASGGGFQADMTPKGAKALLAKLEKEWGVMDAQTIILRGMINSAESVKEAA